MYVLYGYGRHIVCMCYTGMVGILYVCAIRVLYVYCVYVLYGYGRYIVCMCYTGMVGILYVCDIRVW